MGFFYISFLALIQGITEFLPISSSGHLVAISQILGEPNHNLNLDISIHFGSLLAVILYFRKDVLSLISGLFSIIKLETDSTNAKFFLLLIIATIPVTIAGFFAKFSGLSTNFRSIEVIGFTMIIFGLILLFADKKGSKDRNQESWSYKDALIMGFLQCLALVPGTSRSGITITGGLALGFSRESSTKLSMLMSIPTILASGILLTFDLAYFDKEVYSPSGLALAASLSFLSALLALSVLIRYIKYKNFTPFVAYRVLFGIFLLYLAYM